MDKPIHYVGISGSSLPVERFDLGHGVWIYRTFAHFMSPYMMAFAPAREGQHHPPPWRPAEGGFSFDITMELRIGEGSKPGGLNVTETAAWIVAVLRLGFAPHLMAPVTINMPFSEAAGSKIQPKITPLEIEPRSVPKIVERHEEIPLAQLEWLKGIWHSSAELARAHPKLMTALLAWDACRMRAPVSQSLLTVWGALEQLFAPSSGELRYRVASNIATYLEPRGHQRLETYKQILKLYDARSVAAHTTKEVDRTVLIRSWIILRNAVVKMINEHRVPSQSDFEHLLFADVSPVEDDAVCWSGRPNAGSSTEVG